MQADSPELDKFLKQFIAQQRNYFNYLSLSETSYSEQDQTQHKKCSEEAFRISSLKNKRKKTPLDSNIMAATVFSVFTVLLCQCWCKHLLVIQSILTTIHNMLLS